MKIFKNIAFLVVGLLLFSCTEDKAILVDDTLLNYEIPKLPVNTDYKVGAIYTRFAKNINVNLVETPSIGKFNDINDNNLPTVYEKHVIQAQTAGVDFFIFNLRSSNAITQYNEDKGFIDNLQTAPNSNEMKFAFSYNFANMGLSIANTIENKGLVPKFIDDFKLMLPYFQKSNYMKINGKAVVYMNNSSNLFSNDNPALYLQLRNEMATLGVELYLIGMQLEWTPTLRFFGDEVTGKDNRFEDCVDALTVTNYANIELVFYDRLLFFHKYVDIAWSYHKETLAKKKIEFVPTISPSFTPKINNASSTAYVIAKNADWFKANCNIARRASGSSKLVLIDSFNNWNFDTQIESATSYGDEYLKIVKSEFKLNQQ
jgi:hypothetical protein